MKSELRKILEELCEDYHSEIEHGQQEQKKLLPYTVDAIIELFNKQGWVSPENAKKVQDMVNQMVNLANDAFHMPTIQYIKPNKAMTKAQNLMTGQEWFGYFLQEFSGIPVNTEITINIDEIMKAAQRASGLADIKSRIEE